MYRYARTKIASTINLHDAYEDLCLRWNQQVATILAKKLGWKPEYSKLDFVVRDPVSRRNYVKGHLVDDQRVQISGEIAGHHLDRAGTLRAIDSDAVADDVFWIIKEHGDDNRTAHFDDDSLRY